MADSLNLAERLFVAALQIADVAVQLIDSVRPKILLKHSISYYRNRISAEVYLEDLARALGARGRLKVTY